MTANCIQAVRGVFPFLSEEQERLAELLCGFGFSSWQVAMLVAWDINGRKLPSRDRRRQQQLKTAMDRVAKLNARSRDFKIAAARRVVQGHVSLEVWKDLLSELRQRQPGVAKNLTSLAFLAFCEQQLGTDIDIDAVIGEFRQQRARPQG